MTTIRAQTLAPASLRNRIWRDLIRAKLANQSAILTACRPKDPAALKAASAIHAMNKRVKPGEPENGEALAAQNYWPRLFPGLVRSNDDDGRNAWLNYAYAIMRSAIARELAALGFELALGVHHQRELNPQNLADDMIEPFRPLYDRIVFSHLQALGATDNPNAPFEIEHRRSLANVLAEQVSVEGGSVTLLPAASRTDAG